MQHKRSSTLKIRAHRDEDIILRDGDYQELSPDRLKKKGMRRQKSIFSPVVSHAILPGGLGDASREADVHMLNRPIYIVDDSAN